MATDDWIDGFNFNVEEWPTTGGYGRFMIRMRTQVVKRHPEGEW